MPIYTAHPAAGGFTLARAVPTSDNTVDLRPDLDSADRSIFHASTAGRVHLHSWALRDRGLRVSDCGCDDPGWVSIEVFWPGGPGGFVPLDPTLGELRIEAPTVEYWDEEDRAMSACESLLGEGVELNALVETVAWTLADSLPGWPMAIPWLGEAAIAATLERMGHRDTAAALGIHTLHDKPLALLRSRDVDLIASDEAAAAIELGWHNAGLDRASRSTRPGARLLWCEHRDAIDLLYAALRRGSLL